MSVSVPIGIPRCCTLCKVLIRLQRVLRDAAPRTTDMAVYDVCREEIFASTNFSCSPPGDLFTQGIFPPLPPSLFFFPPPGRPKAGNPRGGLSFRRGPVYPSGFPLFFIFQAGKICTSLEVLQA